MSEIARLAALTRLELVYLDADSSANYKPLHKLGLVELCLFHCMGLAKALMAPGAFPALQKLHVEEASPEDDSDKEYGFPDFSWLEEDLLPASAVFSHPSLVQLSGKLAIFSNMPREWKRCSRASASFESASSSSECWRKVQGA